MSSTPAVSTPACAFSDLIQLQDEPEAHTGLCSRSFDVSCAGLMAPPPSVACSLGQMHAHEAPMPFHIQSPTGFHKHALLAAFPEELDLEMDAEAALARTQSFSNYMVNMLGVDSPRPAHGDVIDQRSYPVLCPDPQTSLCPTASAISSCQPILKRALSPSRSPNHTSQYSPKALLATFDGSIPSSDDADDESGAMDISPGVGPIELISDMPMLEGEAASEIHLGSSAPEEATTVPTASSDSLDADLALLPTHLMDFPCAEDVLHATPADKQKHNRHDPDIEAQNVHEDNALSLLGASSPMQPSCLVFDLPPSSPVSSSPAPVFSSPLRSLPSSPPETSPPLKCTELDNSPQAESTQSIDADTVPPLREPPKLEGSDEREPKRMVR